MFNLDGPDGFSYYWHDIRKEKRIFLTRTGDGGSVMVWAAFSCTGKSSIGFCKPKMKSVDYQNVMEEYYGYIPIKLIQFISKIMLLFINRRSQGSGLKKMESMLWNGHPVPLI